MTKRGRSWDPDLERQLKKHINNQLGNENDSTYMNTVFEKTYSLLFEGAKKAQEKSVQPGNQADPLSARMEGSSEENLEAMGDRSQNQILPEASFMKHYMGLTLAKMKEETSTADDKQSDSKRYKQLSLESLWTPASFSPHCSDSSDSSQPTLDIC